MENDEILESNLPCGSVCSENLNLRKMNTAVAMEGLRSDKIEWKQLWSLAALYASIVIGWIAYHNYQPKLLEQFHFTDFTFLLIVAQGIILIITPLIAGKLGDKYRFQKGHRIMIQIQSSWFPLVDRNPQKFVNIYEATESDYQKAIIKIWHDAKNASNIILPVLK